MAAPFIEHMGSGYDTHVGRFLLVLDEPSATLDPEAEAGLFARFQIESADRLSILISDEFRACATPATLALLTTGP